MLMHTLLSLSLAPLALSFLHTGAAPSLTLLPLSSSSLLVLSLLLSPFSGSSLSSPLLFSFPLQCLPCLLSSLLFSVSRTSLLWFFSFLRKLSPSPSLSSFHVPSLFLLLFLSSGSFLFSQPLLPPFSSRLTLSFMDAAPSLSAPHVSLSLPRPPSPVWSRLSFMDAAPPLVCCTGSLLCCATGSKVKHKRRLFLVDPCASIKEEGFLNC